MPTFGAMDIFVSQSDIKDVENWTMADGRMVTLLGLFHLSVKVYKQDKKGWMKFSASFCGNRLLSCCRSATEARVEALRWARKNLISALEDANSRVSKEE